MRAGAAARKAWLRPPPRTPAPISRNSVSAASHKSRLPPARPPPACRPSVAAFRPAAAAGRRASALRVLAQATAAPAAAPAKADPKASQYALQTLTTWLLDLERE